MIKALLFDIDGVLLDSFEANLKFFQNLMIETGYKPPTREEFTSIFHLTMVDAIKVLTKSNSEEEIKKIWEIARSPKILYYDDLLFMPEGAEGVLEELSKSYLLGIVTSRVKESVYKSSKLREVEKYFKVTVSYQDTDKHKPYPDPLLLAANKLNIKPEECVYIGDVENDLKAARAAGMKGIVYSKDKFDHADGSTSSFRELPKLIKDISSRFI